MQFNLNRLQHRRTTIDGGEDYDVYFGASSRPNAVLMRVVKQNSDVALVSDLDKGTYDFLIILTKKKR
jgi:hypothetical protein